ncbi:MAG: PKD domain-containing protein, partial [Woeseiaceae bacterium]
MKLALNLETAALAAAALMLAACGGGQDTGDAGPPANRAPTANAGADRTVAELMTVNLSGSGSDPDGDALSYSWAQTGGQSVSIANNNMA